MEVVRRNRKPYGDRRTTDELMAEKNKGAAYIEYFHYLETNVPFSKLVYPPVDLPEYLMICNISPKKIIVTRIDLDVIFGQLWYPKKRSKEQCSCATIV